MNSFVVCHSPSPLVESSGIGTVGANGTNGLAAGSNMALCVKSSSVRLVTAAESSGLTVLPTEGRGATATDVRSIDDVSLAACTVLSDMMGGGGWRMVNREICQAVTSFSGV